MSDWRFSSLLDASRRAKLAASQSFGVIAQRIAGEMRILCTHADPCDEAAGFTRLVSCIRVDTDLFDLFFNSETGYRGCYFVSPEAGLAANSLLLDLLAAPLAHFITHANMTTLRAEQSLRASSAKSWLAEVGKGFCTDCAGDWTIPQDDTPELLNNRWERGNAVASRSGRKAPCLHHIRVLGAFVDDAGKQYVATQKWTRDQQIHQYGWS
jgi:hypothetical protein